MRFAFFRPALAVALSACLAASATAQESRATPAASVGAWGKPATAATRTAAPASVAIGPVNATIRYSSASFGTGAVGLRNRGEGGIEVSGVSGSIKNAFLYWAAITQGAPTAAQSNVYLRKSGSYTNIVGTPIGTGLSPCWAGDRTTVYRGAVPISLAGNGYYTILLRPGANGNTSGSSPWSKLVSAAFRRRLPRNRGNRHCDRVDLRRRVGRTDVLRHPHLSAEFGGERGKRR